MATNKSKGKNGKPPPPNPLDTLLDSLTRGEVIGVLLILIALFTFLSLVTGSRGTVTGAWVNALSAAFGIGLWGFPIVLAAAGLWLVIHAVERMPDLPWQRPAALALLLLAFVTGAALYGGGGRQAGGWLGAAVGDALRGTVGLGGAWAFVTFIAFVGLVLVVDHRLLDSLDRFRYRIGDRWEEWRAGRPDPAFQPHLPLPGGRIPWWRRGWEWMRGARPEAGPHPPPLPNLVTPHPPARGAQPAAKPGLTPTIIGGAPPSRGAAPAGAADLLTPRIVGSGQEWQLPNLGDMLNDWERRADSDDLIRHQGRLIQETLALFGVPADFEGAYKGPAVTQYLIRPGYVERTIGGETKRIKVKVSKIQALANDLALALAAPSVRIEAPIPGTNYVGIEVPNQESNIVGLKELMESDVFQDRRTKGRLLIALGEDVKGQPVVTDLTRMPHLLIAGATGSGKSVAINSIIVGLLLAHTPDELRLLLVDPKMVELSLYNGVPHLLSPVVTEVDKAAGVLFWAVKEMERRYQLFSKVNARDLERYNAGLAQRSEKPLPYIVLIVDEMADLMMAAPEEVEKHICRLAQMARAVGLHLVIATQRPSVDVITGLIKANFPARIAFAVTSQIDSRVILDVPGAERLLGRGDMLFMAPDAGKLERLQGTFLTDDEIGRVVRYWKGIRSYEDSGPPTHTPAPVETAGTSSSVPAARPPVEPPSARSSAPLAQPPLFEQIEALRAEGSRDELFDEAVRAVREAGRGSATLLQRKLRIGYSRASRLVEELERAGILGPDNGGSAGRELLSGTDSPSKSTPSIPPHIIGGEPEDEPPSPPRIWM